MNLLLLLNEYLIFLPFTSKDSFGITEYINVLIGVGLVGLLATVAGVGVMCYKRIGTLCLKKS